MKQMTDTLRSRVRSMSPPPIQTSAKNARAWLALPGGAAFTQLGGLVSLGSLNVNTGGSLTGSIVVRTSAWFG